MDSTQISPHPTEICQVSFLKHGFYQMTCLMSLFLTPFLTNPVQPFSLDLQPPNNFFNYLTLPSSQCHHPNQTRAPLGPLTRSLFLHLCHFPSTFSPLSPGLTPTCEKPTQLQDRICIPRGPTASFCFRAGGCSPLGLQMVIYGSLLAFLHPLKMHLSSELTI